MTASLPPDQAEHRRSAASRNQSHANSTGAETDVVLIEVSPGELLDKITILEIKNERIRNEAKLLNVRTELAALEKSAAVFGRSSETLSTLKKSLKDVNVMLWEIEDEIRICERDQDFGARFVELARSVYRRNDRRAELKREINELLGSRLKEEKDYVSY